MKLETIERMADDAASVKGAITFSCGRNRVSAVCEKGAVRFTINGWPAPEDEARRALDALQTGWPIKLPG